MSQEGLDENNKRKVGPGFPEELTDGAFFGCNTAHSLPIKVTTERMMLSVRPDKGSSIEGMNIERGRNGDWSQVYLEEFTGMFKVIVLVGRSVLASYINFYCSLSGWVVAKGMTEDDEKLLLTQSEFDDIHSRNPDAPFLFAVSAEDKNTSMIWNFDVTSATPNVPAGEATESADFLPIMPPTPMAGPGKLAAETTRHVMYNICERPGGKTARVKFDVTEAPWYISARLGDAVKEEEAWYLVKTTTSSAEAAGEKEP